MKKLTKSQKLQKAIKAKDTSIIPFGVYCFKLLKVTTNKNGMPILKTGRCPYFTQKKYGKVYVDFCSFLDKGDYGGLNDEEYGKLLNHFGGDDEKMRTEIPLGLLWDGCKECKINEPEGA